ncbi:hypothetical protein ABK040_010967 [Willaertia magna]
MTNSGGGTNNNLQIEFEPITSSDIINHHQLITPLISPSLMKRNKGIKFENKNIFDAIKTNNLPLAHFLINEYYCEINDEYDDDRGATPLHIACIEGYNEMVQLLIKYGAKLDGLYCNQNDEKQTPFMWAIMGGNLNVVQTLMKEYQQIYNLEDEYDLFRKLYSIHKEENTRHNMIVIAIQNDNLSIVQYFLPLLLKIGAKNKIGGNNNEENLIDGEFLRELRENEEHLDSEQHTLLHWACYVGHLGIIKYIIQFIKYHLKTDKQTLYQFYLYLTAKDANQRTILHWIARKGYLNIMRYILNEILTLEIILGESKILNLLSEDVDLQNNTVADYIQTFNQGPLSEGNGSNDNIYMSDMVEKFMECYNRNNYLALNYSSIINEEFLTYKNYHVNEKILSNEMNEILRHQSITVNQTLRLDLNCRKQFINTTLFIPILEIIFGLFPIYISFLAILSIFIFYAKIRQVHGHSHGNSHSHKHQQQQSGGRELAERRYYLLGVFLGTAIAFVITYLFHMYPYLVLVDPLFTNLFITPLFFISMAIMLYTWYLLSFKSDPGFYGKENGSAIDKVFLEKEGYRVFQDDKAKAYYSEQLMIHKPIRARYDRLTEQIITRFDHYCGWTLNPVGELNHRLFVILVYSAYVVGAVFQYGTINSIKNIWNHDYGNVVLFNNVILDGLYIVFIKLPEITYFSIFNFVLVYFVGALLVKQTKGFIFNTTYIESLLPERYIYMRPNQYLTQYAQRNYNYFIYLFLYNAYDRINFVNLFDKGNMANFIEFWFEKKPKYDKIYEIEISNYMLDFCKKNQIPINDIVGRDNSYLLHNNSEEVVLDIV